MIRNGAWDGVTMTDDPIVGDIPESEPSDPDEEAEEATTTLAFHQNGWDNDYMNLPWANTEYATDFSLSGYGDYPEFTWE